MGLYFIGGLLLIAGVAMLLFWTGIAAWVPGTVAVAGLVILVGLLVMGLSERASEPPRERAVDRPVREREIHHYDTRRR